MVGSLFSGMILVAVWVAILSWIGRLFGGIGSTLDVQKMYVCTGVFDSVMLLLYSILILRMGKAFFVWNAGEYMTFSDFSLVLLGTVVKIWSYVFLLVALSEIHAFSKWRSFFTIVCVMVPFSLLMGLI